MMIAARRLCPLIPLVVLTACEPSNLVPVTGQVLLNGEPLEGVFVTFEPDSGLPSTGITDAQGNFSLALFDGQVGAEPGHHRVRITSVTHTAGSVEQEFIPAMYNVENRAHVRGEH